MESASGPEATKETVGVADGVSVPVGLCVNVAVGVIVRLAVGVGVKNGGGPTCGSSNTACAVITGILPDKPAIAA